MSTASLFHQIGYAGIALVLCGLFAMYLGIKTFVYLYCVWREFKREFLSQNIKTQEDIAQIYNKTSNPLVSIINDIVVIHSEHSEDMRSEVSYLMHRNFENVSKSLVWLRLIAVISPLLGLLGTVLGMVGVFQAISTNGNPNSAELAGGIWEAMITTVMGLVVAIPTLIIYYYLLLKFRGFHIEAVEHSYRMLDICKRK